MRSGEVVVVPYNNNWPSLFAQEADNIKTALGSNCIAIHHIGSTAVPGLAAKPIIDILPVVEDIMLVDAANGNMEKLGYSCKGEFGMLFRRYFQKEQNGIRTYNVHVFEKDSPDIERHILFRNWMRDNAVDRQAYAELKQNLAKQYSNDIFQYVMGKDSFVSAIDAKTGFNGLRIVKALTDQQWQHVHELRQKFIFDSISITDPYTWTFTHTDHVHLCLYKGNKVIGYAHIQLWHDKRAALRIIVLEPDHRRQKIGSIFLGLIERWLAQQAFNSLHVQSTPAALAFYQTNNYVPTPFKDPDHYETDPRDTEVGKRLSLNKDRR